MRLVHPVTYDQVRAVYLRDHPADRPHPANSNRDGEKALAMAEELLGAWSLVRLTREEVLGVVLPWHLSEGGAVELVPRSGLTVGEAADRIRAGGPGMAAANPVCAGKLELLRSAPLTPVYLSTRPVPHSDYGDLRVRTGLIHLDGLHRMIAWELSRRLPPGETLEAFVAGSPVPATRPPHRRPDTARTGGPRP
ncbi:DUF6309 family protein [Nocardiopsis sp. NPDC101807]|uniref:DUF6309 family protein n=1 Tax=Nocardiopsis sp. NPDC101807 TaxID=3364339 RepID=UPI0038039FF6